MKCGILDIVAGYDVLYSLEFNAYMNFSYGEKSRGLLFSISRFREEEKDEIIIVKYGNTSGP